MASSHLMLQKTWLRSKSENEWALEAAILLRQKMESRFGASRISSDMVLDANLGFDPVQRAFWRRCFFLKSGYLRPWATKHPAYITSYLKIEACIYLLWKENDVLR